VQAGKINQGGLRRVTVDANLEFLRHASFYA
jgi:hypothetical protein